MSIDFSNEKKDIRSAFDGFSEILNIEKVSVLLDKNIDAWSDRVSLHLVKSNPFSVYFDRVSRFESSLARGETYDCVLDDYEEFCKFSGTPFKKSFWIESLKSEDKESLLSSRLLLDRWKIELDKESSSWEIDQINLLRRKFIENLETWLSLIRQLDEGLSGLGFDFGVWFDESLGGLDRKNIEQLVRWSTYLSKDPCVQEISELLGRMWQVDRSSEIEVASRLSRLIWPVPDINSKEEIIGIHLGKDLEYALPSELALMSDDDTSILFDLKFVESRLTCFELRGESLASEDVSEEVEVELDSDDKKGPMILCVDTSASMAGSPENIAKAIALFLGGKAKSQGRKCFLISFSTRTDVFEVTDSKGVSEIVSFLSRSFHGGTDVEPALRRALDVLKTEAYEKSDVLVISDFVMSSLSDEVVSDINACKALGNKFYSLVIGNYFKIGNVRSYFDSEWIYDQRNHRIHELLGFTQEVLNPSR